MGTNVMELFESGNLVKVCAPMVRYSKLPFRALVRLYNCDLCFTPMIIADSFIRSELARNNEFSTNSRDAPLIVQFAANNAHDFCSAAEMVAPYSNGVDLNCGCPQRWAMKDGFGAHLLSRPELVRDLILQVRNKIPHPYTVSVKIRILDDIRETVDMCRMLEAAGVSFITVHARTPIQRHQPINVNALCTIRESVQLPLIANGDVKTLSDAEDLKLKTGCVGVMAARGVLANPALFAGYSATPLECVKQWVDISLRLEANFTIFHHHLSFMLEKAMSKVDRVSFNSLKTVSATLKYLEKNYDMDFSESSCPLSDVGNCAYGVIANPPSKLARVLNCDVHEDFMENSCLFES